MAKYIAGELGRDVSEMTYDYLTSDALKEEFGQATFCTATDGNHGRGVAWAANKLGQKAIVHMPKGSSKYRFDNIAKENAKVTIEEVNYDECVRIAAAEADATPHGVIVQDTAWEGYEKIPVWIMKGYMTMALEAAEEYGTVPTHIFLQAGVGAMSGALTGFFADYYGKQKPIITIVEPNKADCIFRTAEAGDGRLHNVEGSLSTIMAGLACGEPCMIGWEELGAYADNFMSVPDYVAAKGMRILGNPTGNDGRVISGESGAAALGCAAEILQNESLEYIRRILKLDQNSRILCFSTEGDTDKDNYRKIVWDGLYPSY
jgi:diaminopropionate ammonia-lyase